MSRVSIRCGRLLITLAKASYGGRSCVYSAPLSPETVSPPESQACPEHLREHCSPPKKVEVALNGQESGAEVSVWSHRHAVHRVQLPRAAGIYGFAMIGKDHISLPDARSEDGCQCDEVFRRFSVKVASLAAFKVQANQTFY